MTNSDIVIPPPPSSSPVDMVNHPPHYRHPSGAECITIAEHMTFCRGNAFKYVWRAGEKGDEIEDLEKARWYLDREIARLRLERDTDDANCSPNRQGIPH